MSKMHKPTSYKKATNLPSRSAVPTRCFVIPIVSNSLIKAIAFRNFCDFFAAWSIWQSIHLITKNFANVCKFPCSTKPTYQWASCKVYNPTKKPIPNQIPEISPLLFVYYPDFIEPHQAFIQSWSNTTTQKYKIPAILTKSSGYLHNHPKPFLIVKNVTYSKQIIQHINSFNLLLIYY